MAARPGYRCSTMPLCGATLPLLTRIARLLPRHQPVLRMLPFPWTRRRFSSTNNSAVISVVDPKLLAAEVLNILRSGSSAQRKNEYLQQAQTEIDFVNVSLKQQGHTSDRIAAASLARLAAIYHTHGMLEDADVAYRDLLARLSRDIPSPPVAPTAYPASLLQVKTEGLRLAMAQCDYGSLLENRGHLDAAAAQYEAAARNLLLPLPLPFFTSMQYFKGRSDDAAALPAAPTSMLKQTPEQRRLFAMFHAGQRTRNVVVANLAMLSERSGHHNKCDSLHRHVFFESMFAFDGMNDSAPRWDLPHVVSYLWLPHPVDLDQPTEIAKAIARSSTLFGSDHRSLISPLYQLAIACIRAKALPPAEEALRRVITIETILSGPSSTPVATALGLLSRVYLLDGRFAEAREVAQKAFDIKKNTLSTLHFHTALLGCDIGMALLATSSPLEAYDILEQSAGVLEAFTKDHPWRLRVKQLGVKELREELQLRLPDVVERMSKEIPEAHRQQVAQLSQHFLKMYQERQSAPQRRSPSQ